MNHVAKASSRRTREASPARAPGFTLIELLVVIALVLILCGFLVPVLSSAMEKARVAKVYAELQQIEVALTLYYADHQQHPPVRLSCNTDEWEHYCELPKELVEEHYMPPSNKKGVSSMMEDPFYPGHTYKYVAPGPYYQNGDLQPYGFGVFVPDDFPVCKSAGGSTYEGKESPLAWAVWSLGPRQSSAKALNRALAPVSRQTWYQGTGDNGVIARIRPRYGAAFQTP